MRKIVFLIGIIALTIVGLSIYSCQKGENRNEQKTDVVTAKTMEFVGIEHNQLLEESFEFLKKEYNNNNYTAKSVIDRKQRLERFLIYKIQTNTKYSKESNDLGVKYIKKQFALNQNKKTSKQQANIYDDNSAKLSRKVKVYLGKLDIILDKIDLNNNVDIENQIHILEKGIEGDKNLTDTERIILFSSTQTARYSYRYWKENIYKWSDLNLNKSTTTLKGLQLSIYANSEKGDGKCPCEHAKDIVKYDVGGAAGGAVGAAVVNVVPGWGQVAYGGAIVGGAVAASVTEGVKKLLDWLW